MNRLKLWLKRLLGIDQLEQRIIDLERHFVTRRDETGKVVETLADVSLEKRKERATRPRGMSTQQLREWAEKTDGGRLA